MLNQPIELNHNDGFLSNSQNHPKIFPSKIQSKEIKNLNSSNKAFSKRKKVEKKIYEGTK